MRLRPPCSSAGSSSRRCADRQRWPAREQTQDAAPSMDVDAGCTAGRDSRQGKGSKERVSVVEKGQAVPVVPAVSAAPAKVNGSLLMHKYGSGLAVISETLAEDVEEEGQASPAAAAAAAEHGQADGVADDGRSEDEHELLSDAPGAQAATELADVAAEAEVSDQEQSESTADARCGHDEGCGRSGEGGSADSDVLQLLPERKRRTRRHTSGAAAVAGGVRRKGSSATGRKPAGSKAGSTEKEVSAVAGGRGSGEGNGGGNLGGLLGNAVCCLLSAAAGVGVSVLLNASGGKSRR